MQDEHKKLWELIKDLRVTMMTTTEADQTLRSRPMYTQQAEFDGQLWFFTKDDAPKTDEIEQDRHINLAYAEPGNDTYISVSGTARLIHDKQKAEEMWSPMVKAWFPEGLDDPHLGLIRVEPTQAEYWDASESKMVQLFKMGKAIAQGEEAGNLGDNEKVSL